MSASAASKHFNVVPYAVFSLPLTVFKWALPKQDRGLLVRRVRGMGLSLHARPIQSLSEHDVD
jgi:hypothetical protein